MTGRSINAGGTINASGADYAEYMHKASGCRTVKPGQIVGIDAHGQITDKWVDAITFAVKSTDPCMVGGDRWSEHLGNRPEPVERIMPYTRPVLIAEATPEIPAEFQEVDGEVIEVTPSIPAKEAEYIDEEVPGDSDEEWEAKQAPLKAFDAALERVRESVDRIAFCGQVPVNVINAVPGQYIVPTQDGDGICGLPIHEADITFTQYQRAIGKVIALEDDGRARIVVKVV